MRDTSGASVMDAKTQITQVHGVSVLEAAKRPLESNLCHALLREPGGANDSALMNVAITAGVNLHGDADARGSAGGARSRQRAQRGARRGVQHLWAEARRSGAQGDRCADRSLRAFRAPGRARRSLRLRARSSWRQDKALLHRREARPEGRGDARRPCRAQGEDRFSCATCARWAARSTRDAVLAAICATLAWGPLMRKRISRETVRGLPWYVGLWATLIGASVDAARHEPQRFCGIPNEESGCVMVGDRARLPHADRRARRSPRSCSRSRCSPDS